MKTLLNRMSLVTSVKQAVKARILRREGLQYHASVRFNGLPRFMIAPGSSVVINDNAVINSKWNSNSISSENPTTFITLSQSSVIEVGRDSGISGSVLSAMVRVRVGDRVLIGAGCLITDSDHHPVDVRNASDRRYAPATAAASSPITIEDDVFIGTRSIILKGVTIGRGAVVGAGSVVSRDVPAYAIAAGNPCRVIRQTERKEHL